MANSKNQLIQKQTKQRLRQAMGDLIVAKAFSDISIIDLTEHAGVSRMAFYRHYSSKEAVLIDYVDEQLAPLYDFLTRLPHKGPLFICQAYFQYVDAHSGLFEALIQTGAELVPAECFRDYAVRFYAENVPQVPFAPDFKRYFNSYVGAGLYQMTLDWIKDDKRAPRTLLAQIAAKQAV
ncbi:TetR/AcrR family transcriptional regulator [Lacticaseibacillus hegangensis]|uniref:TetR/AcrR family transcriptional regulator n=1 Tax=Lacticaseibacillus hegangensis TaxID=2486010 RepID=A0ABW4CUZ6_9LACO|nr:TetR/AcrR family transcriptional regulator [Lacticaseibacillus hegangensis]